MFNCVTIHYGEIALKGRNRPFFEKRLVENIRVALRGESIEGVKRISGRIIVGLTKDSNIRGIKGSLSKVFGIEWFAFAYSVGLGIEEMGKAVLERTKGLIDRDTAIRVHTQRANKKFPYTSMELNREIGSLLVKEYNAKVSMSEPRLRIFIEIAEDEAYLFFEKIKGLGGLPVGVSGKVLALLSGGIDSAVAAWLMMKRGCEVDFLHVHAFRKGREVHGSKIFDLIETLRQFQFGTKVHLVPFCPFRFKVWEKIPRYELVLFRRFMLRVGEAIAKEEGIKGLVTGDNLGQVASQTLENMLAAEDQASLPVFRPLLTYDKREIVDLAKKIGTYDFSIAPYKDCCSIIARHPETRAKLGIVRELEAQLEIQRIVDECLALMEIERLPGV